MLTLAAVILVSYMLSLIVVHVYKDRHSTAASYRRLMDAIRHQSLRRTMEPISEADVTFIIVLNASEESSLQQLKWELEAWDLGTIDVAKILSELIAAGLILFTEIKPGSHIDYSIEASKELAKKWADPKSAGTALFLTETGYARWDSPADWGITRERENYLGFSNRGGIARIPGSK